MVHPNEETIGTVVECNSHSVCVPLAIGRALDAKHPDRRQPCG
jgi:hypothetical protein